MRKNAFDFALGRSWMAIGLLFLSGCVTGLGPRALRQEQVDYNRHIVTSANEQMLLNLVRLRYNDTPMFLSLGTVVAQYSLESRLGGGGNATITPYFTDGLNFNGGSSWSERPTVTFVPLQGTDFANQMLSPIHTDTITVLSQTGWSIERLLLVCVQRINDVGNASSATGPTPEEPPRFQQMTQLAQSLRRLQKAGLWAISHNQTRTPIFWLREPPDTDHPQTEDIAVIRRLLELPGGTNEFPVTSYPYKRRPHEIGLRGRTMLGTLFYLSQAVDLPISDAQRGIATTTRLPDGSAFDWSVVMGHLFRVRTSDERPKDAWIAVQHRNHWFYIPDDDRETKSTFNLLNLLFSLQAVTSQGKSPMLTLPVGPT